MSVDTIYAESDYITLHASLTEGSKNMIGADGHRQDEGRRGDRQLRAGAAGRQRKAMLAALDERQGALLLHGRLRQGAAGGRATRSWRTRRRLVTPHLGGSTEEAEILGARQAAEEIAAFFKEGKVINSVNFFPGDPALAPWEPVAEKIGDFAYQFLVDGDKVSQVAFRYNGSLPSTAPSG